MKISNEEILEVHEAYFEGNPNSHELEDMEGALQAAAKHLDLVNMGLRVKQLEWKPSFRGVHVSEPFPGIIYRVWENGVGTYQMYSPNVEKNASVYGVRYEDILSAKIAAQNEWNTIALDKFFEWYEVGK